MNPKVIQFEATEEENAAFHAAFFTDEMTQAQCDALMMACAPVFVMGYRAAKAKKEEANAEQLECRALLAKRLEYPGEWDTAAYPNLESAALEGLATKEAERKAFYTMDQMRDFADGVVTTRLYVVVDALETKINHFQQNAEALQDAGDAGLAGVYNLSLAELRTIVDNVKRMGAKSFQRRATYWAKTCFGETLATDRRERAHRFAEEAIELVQACGMTKREVLAAVDYVFGRPVGELWQEVGGTYTTLAVLCQAFGIDMVGAGERDLMEISNVEVTRKIRMKRTTKPDFGVDSIEPISERKFLDSLHALPNGLFHILTNKGENLSLSGKCVYDLLQNHLRS